jgi:hypothetical protein
LAWTYPLAQGAAARSARNTSGIEPHRRTRQGRKASRMQIK